METNVIVLNGRDIYGQVRVLSTGENLADKNGDAYWRATYGGKVFIIREDVKAAFDAANISQLSLATTEREVDVLDPESGEKTGTTKAEGLEYAGHLTYTQAINITKNEATLKAIELRTIKELAALEAEPAM